MERVQYIIDVSKETAQKLEKYVDYRNKQIEYESLNHSKVHAEDLIRGALVEYLALFNDADKVKNVLGILLHQNDNSIYQLKNRFKEIMKAQNMKQVDLVQLIGVSKTNLSQILNNKYPPGLELFLKIWVALDCPPLNEVFYLEYKNK